MKRLISIVALVVLTVSMIAMTSCGKSEFSGESKRATPTPQPGMGEQVAIDTKLESGEITVEFISAEGMDNPDEVPDLEGEATYTAYLSGTNQQAVSFGAGSFMIKPTVTEKATGTIDITVEPAN